MVRRIDRAIDFVSLEQQQMPPQRHKHKDKMMFDLTGKNALITGASGGIGGAIAKSYTRQAELLRSAGHA